MKPSAGVAWRQSEYTVTYALRHRGISCKNVGRLNLPWDIITAGGLKIGVKDSELHRGKWAVNRRRHGQSKRGDPDFYVICLRGLQGFKGVAQRLFVILSNKEFTGKMQCWTLRSLLHHHAKHIGDWGRILRSEHRRKHAVSTR
jgi:hypothetical protein